MRSCAVGRSLRRARQFRWKSSSVPPRGAGTGETATRRRSLDEERHVVAMLSQRSSEAPARPLTMYEKMAGMGDDFHDLRSGFRRTGEATGWGAPMLEAEERPDEQAAPAFSGNALLGQDAPALPGADDDGEAHSVLEARAHDAVRRAVRDAPRGAALTISIEDDIANLEDFDWDVEAAAAQRIHARMALEEERLKDESKAIDGFLGGDWHSTLARLQSQKVKEVWHEFHTSGQPLDAITYDRLLHRYDEVCEAVHHEWMGNSSHMTWADANAWKNPVWEDSRRRLREVRRKRQARGSTVESVVDAEGAEGLRRLAREHGFDAEELRRARLEREAGARGAPAVDDARVDQELEARLAGAAARGASLPGSAAAGAEEAPALGPSAWAEEDIGQELEAEFAKPATRRRKRRDYRVD